MNKNILKISLLSGLVLAANFSEAKDVFKGAYAGVGVGYIHDETTFDATQIRPEGSVATTNNNGFRKSSYNAFSESLSGGYAFEIKDFYLALEGKLSLYNNYDPKGTFGEKIIYKYGYHATAKFGKSFNDNLLAFVKGGYVNTRMEYKYLDNESLAKEASSMRNGYEYGFGIAYKMTDCLVLGIEASRIEYEKYKFARGANANLGDERLNEFITHKPRLEQVEVKVSYHF